MAAMIGPAHLATTASAIFGTLNVHLSGPESVAEGKGCVMGDLSLKL